MGFEMCQDNFKNFRSFFSIATVWSSLFSDSAVGSGGGGCLGWCKGTPDEETTRRLGVAPNMWGDSLRRWGCATLRVRWCWIGEGEGGASDGRVFVIGGELMDSMFLSCCVLASRSDCCVDSSRLIEALSRSFSEVWERTLLILSPSKSMWKGSSEVEWSSHELKIEGEHLLGKSERRIAWFRPLVHSNGDWAPPWSLNPPADEGRKVGDPGIPFSCIILLRSRRFSSRSALKNIASGESSWSARGNLSAPSLTGVDCDVDGSLNWLFNLEAKNDGTGKLDGAGDEWNVGPA